MVSKDINRKSRWSQDEKARVAKHAGMLMAQDSKLELGIALIQAQHAVLPAIRRYTDQSLKYAAATELKSMAEGEKAIYLRAVRKVVDEAASKVVVPEVAKLPEEHEAEVKVTDKPEEAYGDVISRMMAEMPEKELEQVSPYIPLTHTPTLHPLDKIAKVIEEDISKSIHEYVTSKVNTYIKTYLSTVASIVHKEVEIACSGLLATLDADIKSAADEEFKKHLLAATPKPPKTTMYRVMVVGLVGEQMSKIRQEYGECLRLELIQTNDGVGPIKAIKDNCDFVVMMVKFVHHTTTDAVKGHKGLIMINGGMSELQQSLLNLVCL